MAEIERLERPVPIRRASQEIARLTHASPVNAVAFSPKGGRAASGCEDGTISVWEADYLLFVDQKASGVIEAKPEGTTLLGVAEQAVQYTIGLPANIPHATLPLPFQCESTGVETLFRDNRDPTPRSRRVFTFRSPEKLAERAADYAIFRSHLQHLPWWNTTDLWKAQIETIQNLEASHALDKLQEQHIKSFNISMHLVCRG